MGLLDIAAPFSGASLLAGSGSGGILGSFVNPILGAPPTAPTPIDPNQIISLENQYNRINQKTPFGSLTFGPNGQATMGLSPIYQRIFGRATRNLAGLLGMGAGAFQKQADSATQNYYDKAMNLLQPQIDQQRAQLTQNLADRGLPAGSELYGNLTDASNRDINGLLTNTSLDAVQYGQNLANQLYQQKLQTALQGLGTVPTLNSFYAPSPVDVGGAYGLNANMQNSAYGAASDLYGSELTGLFGLGKAAAGYAAGQPGG